MTGGFARVAWALVMASVGLVLGSCGGLGGYGFESAHDSGVRTVSVDIFENRTSEPGLEIALTEAIIKEIQAHTPWRVADAGLSDTHLSGAVIYAGYRTLSRRRGSGLAQEGIFELSVDFEWTQSRTGEVIESRLSFDALGTFVPTPGVDERLEIGQLGATQKLARRIVDEMRADW